MEILTRTIKAVSDKWIDSGKIGFLTVEEEGHWYNVTGETEALKELIKNVISKGNKIEFEYNNGIVGTLKIIEKAKEPEKNNWADDMTNFEDLLNDAHKKFGKNLSIMTQMISVDFEKKQAVFKAVVVIDKGADDCQKFSGHGDSQGITSETIKPHFMRMAETRAIARALRWATNNAAVAAEETDQTQTEEKK
jgi:hypothetical protein